ncbi:hypothetical protein [Amycolatopsis sp. lyj-23]|uniref:hypothetical protein n=1 Tax=Amycolatopsis sp. lyj-23 TaxID=2789283 RepID=UPI00397805C4
MLGGLFAVAKAGAVLALAGPVLATRQAKKAVSAVAPLAGELAAGAAGTAADATRTGSRTAVRATRVVRNAAGPRSAVWLAGRRLHVPLRPAEDAGRPDGAALAAALAGHADVAGAYWDGGLGSVVLHLAEEAAAGRVLAWVADGCGRHGLTPAEPGDSAPAHPGDTYGVRTAAFALAMDVAGLAVSVGTRATRSRRLHETVRAVASAAREHPAVRAALDERFGWYTAELVRSGVSAAVRGLSQDPLELALDAVLRTGQLTEAIARLTAFDAAHDDLCSPERPSLGVTPPRRRVRVPMEDYARNAVGAACSPRSPTWWCAATRGKPPKRSSRRPRCPPGTPAPRSTRRWARRSRAKACSSATRTGSRHWTQWTPWCCTPTRCTGRTASTRTPKPCWTRPAGPRRAWSSPATTCATGSASSPRSPTTSPRSRSSGW